jgi:hypothetical protein
MEANGQLHVLATLSLGPRYLLDIRLGGPPEPVWTLWRREKSCSCGDSKLDLYPVSHRYIDWAIPAVLVPRLEKQTRSSALLKYKTLKWIGVVFHGCGFEDYRWLCSSVLVPWGRAGNVDVSEVHATSIFRVEVGKVVECPYICVFCQTDRWGLCWSVRAKRAIDGKKFLKTALIRATEMPSETDASEPSPVHVLTRQRCLAYAVSLASIIFLECGAVWFDILYMYIYKITVSGGLWRREGERQ